VRVPSPKWRIPFKNERRSKTQLQLQGELHSRIRGELKQRGFQLQNGEFHSRMRGEVKHSSSSKENSIQESEEN
jgi:hypothetical protein